MAPNDDESVKLFLSIGLDKKTATTTIIHEAGVTNGCDRTTGNLLYTDFKLNEFEEACGVDLHYLFGTRVEVSAEDIEKAADEVFENNKKTIVEQRYRTNVGQLLAHVRKSLPWADPKIVKVS
ncbi:unnamed protein product [Brassica oleracea]